MHLGVLKKLHRFFHRHFQVFLNFPCFFIGILGFFLGCSSFLTCLSFFLGMNVFSQGVWVVS
jgi:hypothetical protein